MLVQTRKTPVARWPFWLLLLAWFCASYPLAAQFAVVWLGKSHAFSHQQRLAAQVARVLVAEKTPSLLDEVKSIPDTPLPLAAPDAMSAKKIELATADSSPSILPAAGREIFREFSPRSVGTRRAPPPHRPPPPAS